MRKESSYGQGLWREDEALTTKRICAPAQKKKKKKMATQLLGLARKKQVGKR